MVKLLLEICAELETKDKDSGWTPLSYAAANGHEAVVKLLLEKGAVLETVSLWFLKFQSLSTQKSLHVALGANLKFSISLSRLCELQEIQVETEPPMELVQSPLLLVLKKNV